MYLATLYPGLLDIGDAAKFSFVGKVLGTPHAPGYPLYTVVSHAFSYVPWGTLAHRMNVLSAVFGALAVALVYRAGRRLGAGRLAAASGALACGFGFAFWSKSLYAKGYTLNAALVAAGIVALLRWDQTRKVRDFYWAVAIFALSIGNHLTVVALLPALVLFALMTDPRTVLRPRTQLVAAAIVLLGLAQYGFIILRTVQQAPYLEARATGLGELWAVMTARRWSHEIGAFSWSAVLATRVPAIWRLVVRELGAVGLGLCVVGCAWLLRHRPRTAALLGLGAIGVAALTANMGSNEDEGFLLSVFVLLGVVGIAGLEVVISVVRRLPRAFATIAVIAVAAVPPIVQCASNYQANNHRGDTFDIRYFDALLGLLPQKAVIIPGEYRIHMMVLYKLLGEQAAGTRDIRTAAPDVDAIARYFDGGYEVVTFAEGKRLLAGSGFRFVPHQSFATAGGGDLFRRRELYRLASTGACLGIGNLGWMDVSKAARQKGRLSFKIDDFHPFESRVTIYAAVDGPPVPALLGLGGAGTPTMTSEVFPRGDASAARRLEIRSVADGLTLPAAVRQAAYVTRMEVRVNDKGAFASYSVDFGETPVSILAKAEVDRDGPDRATVCSHELGPSDAWPASSPNVVIAPDGADAVFGSGWHDVERRPDGRASRWTAANAELIVPISATRAAIVTVAAEPYAGGGGQNRSVELVVNGHRAGVRALTPSTATISWEVPQPFWRAGLNALVFEVTGASRPSQTGASADTRLLGLSVTSIELTAIAGGETVRR